MGDVWAWLLFFFSLIALVVILVYQVIPTLIMLFTLLSNNVIPAQEFLDCASNFAYLC